jgi:hypothetical protein
MDEATRAALSRGGTIEIVFHRIDGRIWISGIPSSRKRAWLANLESDPHLTLHLKGPLATGDLAATARVVTDTEERRRILARVALAWRRTDLDRMVDQSPLIEVTIDPPV